MLRDPGFNRGLKLETGSSPGVTDDGETNNNKRSLVHGKTRVRQCTDR